MISSEPPFSASSQITCVKPRFVVGGTPMADRTMITNSPGTMAVWRTSLVEVRGAGPVEVLSPACLEWPASLYPLFLAVDFVCPHFFLNLYAVGTDLLKKSFNGLLGSHIHIFRTTRYMRIVEYPDACVYIMSLVPFGMLYKSKFAEFCVDL